MASDWRELIIIYWLKEILARFDHKLTRALLTEKKTRSYPLCPSVLFYFWILK